MAKILKGAEVAAALNEKTKTEVLRLEARGVIPALAMLRVGQRQDDLSYQRAAAKRCDAVGIQVKNILLPEDVDQQTLIREIEKLNDNPLVHGVLIFRPLPGQLDDDKVRAALLPEKDVDGITDGSLAGVFTGSGKGYPPCTARACMEILAHYKVDPAGKRAVVLGRSLVVGRPVGMMLMKKNATVTICHTGTTDTPSIARQADILIAAAGRAGLVGKDFLSPGQTIIDVGIHADPKGGLRGDVNFQEAAAVAAAITPVPGGVGAVTTSVLVSHVAKAAGKGTA